MIISQSLAWLGLLATIMFGVLGTYLVIRRRYPVRLVFLREKEIALFEDIVRNLPELAVTYDGTPVSENLILLKGILLNLGDRDITPEMTHQPLTARLPEGFSWRTARIVATSQDLNAAARITEPRVLALDLGLFRRDEHLTIEAVAEVPAPQPGAARGHRSRQLSSAIQFQHRIADAANIEARELPGPLPARRKLYAIVFPIYALVLLAMPAFSRYVLKEGEFRFTSDRGVELRASPRLGDTVVLHDVKTDAKERVALAEFERRPYSSVIRPRTEWKAVGYVTAGLILLGSALYVPLVLDWRRSKKYRRLLVSGDQPSEDQGRVA